MESFPYLAVRVGIEAPKISAPINTNNKSAPGAPGSRNPLLKVTDANRSQRRERAFNAGLKLDQNRHLCPTSRLSTLSLIA